MKGPRFYSEAQLMRGLTLGLKVDTELRQVDLNNSQEKIWDDNENTRQPIFVRIQNISAQPVNWSEGYGKASAVQRNGVLPSDSAGLPNPNGDGGIIEYQRHIPHNLYVHCAGTATLLVTLRYPDES